MPDDDLLSRTRLSFRDRPPAAYLMELLFRAYLGNSTTALGVLTDATQKKIRRDYNGTGEGSFSISRHSSQIAWVAPGNYVRVYIDSIATTPVFAFFIESGRDAVVSSDEEGGEVWQRGGRGLLAYLERAIIDHTSSFGRYADTSWGWTNPTQGQIVKELIDDAQLRSNLLPLLTYDFDATDESGGGTWDTITGTYELPVGMDLLQMLQRQQSAGLVATMSPTFVLSCSEVIGTDLSATVIFEAGVNISDEVTRDVLASDAKSRMLVQGTTVGGNPFFQWVSDAGTETALGDRREGFLQYQATKASGVIDKVGLQAIRRLRRRHDGLSVLGVLTDTFVPFTDYQPGDTVTVNVPGVWSNLEAPITAILLFDTPSGEANCALEFEDIAFEPLQLRDRSDRSGGGSGGPGGPHGGGGGGGGEPDDPCAGCPPFFPTPCVSAWDSFDDRETLIESEDWGSTSDDSIPWLVKNVNSGNDLPTTPGLADAWVSGGIGYLQSGFVLANGLPIAYVESGPSIGATDWEVLFRFRIVTSIPVAAGNVVDVAVAHQIPPTSVSTRVAYVLAPGEDDPLEIAPNTWYLCRFARESVGPSYRWRTWIDGAGEPAEWLDTASVVGEDAFGFVLNAAGSTAGSAELHIDWVDFGDGCSAGEAASGQFVSQTLAVSDGTTTAYRSRSPYMAGSLQVYADDVREWNITETDPSNGDWAFDTAPFSGETIRVEYRAG